jgi:hypothetical protein
MRARRTSTISAVIAAGVHLFPFRTEKLSPPAPMVLGGKPPGRVGRRRITCTTKAPWLRGFSRSSLGPPPRSGRRCQQSRLLAVGVLGAAVTLVAVTARGHASAGPVVAGASRVVDRTFVCSLGLSQRGYPDPGVRRRAIDLYAGSGSDGKSSGLTVLDRHGPGKCFC